MLSRFVTIPVLSIVLCLSLGSPPGTGAQSTPPPLPVTPPAPTPVTPPAPPDEPTAKGPKPPATIVTGVVPDEATLKKIQGYQPCVPKDQAGYRENSCRIQIWRTNPIAPATMTLPKGTDVYIELFDARQNESVTFTLVTGKLAPHDIGAAALQNSIPGLQTIIATQPLHHQQRLGLGARRNPKSWTTRLSRNIIRLMRSSLSHRRSKRARRRFRLAPTAFLPPYRLRLPR